MKKDMENKVYTMYPFALGTSINIEDVNDDIFSKKLAGDGLAIKPINGEIYAPFNGKIVMENRDMFAITLESNEGIEVLIHIGLDTEHLPSASFHNYFNVGDEVSAGDLLISFDHEKIGIGGENDIVVMVIVEPKEYVFYNFLSGEEVVEGTTILNYKKRT